jgi:hypothetical protein
LASDKVASYASFPTACGAFQTLAVIGESRKLHRIQRRLAPRLAAEAVHAFGRVGRKSDARGFAVVADVDAALLLVLDHEIEVTLDLRLQRLFVVRLALFAFDQQSR